MHGTSEVVYFSPRGPGGTVGLLCRRALWGMAQVVVIILANISAHARSASLSCGTRQRRGDGCRSA